MNRAYIQELKRLAVILCLLTMPAIGSAADVKYRYPITGNYEAAIPGMPPTPKSAPPDRLAMRRLVLDVLPGLRKPDVFFYDEGLRCPLAYQEKKAPLVFLIAGTGAGDPSQKKAPAMMNTLYPACFHVTSLPSPTYPNFIISASRNHVPGDLIEYSADLCRAMEAAWEKLEDDSEVRNFSWVATVWAGLMPPLWPCWMRNGVFSTSASAGFSWLIRR